MGIQIDHNHRYTDEERSYLTSRGRGYLLAANERRFGTNDEPREPEEWEKEDSHAVSPFYQNADREAAVYDIGGAPLPNTTLDYNTGRVADRDNGKTVEYTGPGHTPAAYDLSGVRAQVDYVDGVSFTSTSDDDDDIDTDIVEHVLAQPNVASLKKALKERGGEVESDDKREDLENKLAVRLQDLRDRGEDPFRKSEPEPDGNGADSTGAGSDGTAPEDSEDEGTASEDDPSEDENEKTGD